MAQCYLILPSVILKCFWQISRKWGVWQSSQGHHSAIRITSGIQWPEHHGFQCKEIQTLTSCTKMPSDRNSALAGRDWWFLVNKTNGLAVNKCRGEARGDHRRTQRGDQLWRTAPNCGISDVKLCVQKSLRKKAELMSFTWFCLLERLKGDRKKKKKVKFFGLLCFAF